jgi:hypothetical protein
VCRIRAKDIILMRLVDLNDLLGRRRAVHHLGHLKGMDQCVQDSIQQRRVDGSDLSSPRRLPIGRRVILSSVDRGMDALDSIGDDREDTGPIAILGFELQSDDSLCLCKQSMDESSAMQADDLRVVKEMRGNTGQGRAGQQGRACLLTKSA